MFKSLLLFAVLACGSVSAADFGFSINFGRERCEPRPVYVQPSGYWRSVYVPPVVQYQYHRGHYHQVVIRQGYYTREWVSCEPVRYYRYR